MSLVRALEWGKNFCCALSKEKEALLHLMWRVSPPTLHFRFSRTKGGQKKGFSDVVAVVTTVRESLPPSRTRSPEQCAKCFLQLSRRCGVAARSSLPRGRAGRRRRWRRRRRDIGVLNEEVKRPYDCTLPVILLYRPTIAPFTSLYLHLKAKERE